MSSCLQSPSVPQMAADALQAARVGVEPTRPIFYDGGLGFFLAKGQEMAHFKNTNVNEAFAVIPQLSFPGSLSQH